MSTDPLIAAVIFAMGFDECRAGGAEPCGACQRMAGDVLAAVRPLIEAEAREQVAKAIEELPDEMPGYSPNFSSGYRWAVADAARIARGGDA